ncbi:hypothetical protein L195_g056256 [Trifolium pratense]|uniref:Uncharacterized protein n=1 Tax=Trifolium pratense TaxID=57577 RepID=A0A2K3KQN5_TRIPR|nr:hypothetical protein L195_g056256 [Trifolium pratense]
MMTTDERHGLQISHCGWVRWILGYLRPIDLWVSQSEETMLIKKKSEETMGSQIRVWNEGFVYGEEDSQISLLRGGMRVSNENRRQKRRRVWYSVVRRCEVTASVFIEYSG